MPYKDKLIILAFMLFTSLAHALPVRKTDSKTEENSHNGYSSIAGEIKEHGLILEHRKKPETRSSSVCEIIQNENDLVMVKTEGRHSWKTLIDCIKQQTDNSHTYIPFSAAHNPDWSVRKSLVYPINSFVTTGLAQNPLHYVPEYTRLDRETDQSSHCFHIDPNNNCRLTPSTTIPDMYIQLKKLPSNAVVHTEVLFSGRSQSLALTLQAYQTLLSRTSAYTYGVYLHIVPQPAQTITFITASHPGLSLGSAFFYLGETDMLIENQYQDHNFNQYQSWHVPGYLGNPEERENWYVSMHNGWGITPKKGDRFSRSLNDHFFYESHASTSKIVYERTVVSARQLKPALQQLMDRIAEPGKFPCMKTALYGLRVTFLDDVNEPGHVLEIIRKKEGTSHQEEICLKKVMTSLVQKQEL